MATISDEARARLFQEVSIRLLREGYATQPEDEDHCIPVNWHGSRLCRVDEDGDVRYMEHHVEGDDRRTALNAVMDSAREVAEYMRILERAPEMHLEHLDEGFYLMGDYGRGVLAGHPTKEGIQFITWEWNYNHTGVCYGHYFGGAYQKAKNDFAIRAELIERDQLFSAEQLAEVYRSLHATLEGEHPITSEREQVLTEVCSKIERNVTNLETLVSQSAEKEQAYQARCESAPEMSPFQ